MIVLFGATGYTGRLAAAEMAARGEPFAVAGRSRARLESLVAELGAAAEVRVADVAEPKSLTEMLDGATAVVSTVGPFERYGMAVVQAAADAGVPYCDSTGEPSFMHRVAERFADADVPVVPACGFDYVPHDLAVAEAISALGETEIDLVETSLSWRHFSPSRGTMASFVGAIDSPSREWRDGEWRTVPIASRRRTVVFPPPTGERTAVSYPGGDVVAIANHVNARTVRSYIVLPAPVAAVSPLVMSSMRALAGFGQVRSLLDLLVARTREGPSEQRRRRNAWGVLAEASAGDRKATALARGTDTYGATAMFLAAVADRLRRWRDLQIAPGFRAPAEVCGDRACFAADTGFDLRLVDAPT